jgi:hypothetical protein
MWSPMSVSAVKRRGLLDRGYLEVETPMLQQIHGGANVRPFTTHVNAFDLDLHLRIAPEPYLKRLCVGGLEKVFEMGRTFRNEGVSHKHNPEFTMLEAYQAFADYDVMLDLVRALIQGAATAAFGRPVAHKDGTEYDISGPWPVKTVYGAVGEALGEEIHPGTDIAVLRRLSDGAGVPHVADDGHGDIVPAAPHRPASRRALGPRRLRHRTGHRLLGAHRPRRAAPPPHRTVAARRRGRPGGDGTRRGLPRRPRLRDAAHRRPRHRRRPAGHVPHRADDPGDAAVPPGAPPLTRPPDPSG